VRPANADGATAKVEIAVPMFGNKTHISIDPKYGFVCGFAVVSAVGQEGRSRALISIRPTRRATSLADTVYLSKTGEAYLAKVG